MNIEQVKTNSHAMPDRPAKSAPDVLTAPAPEADGVSLTPDAFRALFLESIAHGDVEAVKRTLQRPLPKDLLQDALAQAESRVSAYYRKVAKATYKNRSHILHVKGKRNKDRDALILDHMANKLAELIRLRNNSIALRGMLRRQIDRVTRGPA